MIDFLVGGHFDLNISASLLFAEWRTTIEREFGSLLGINDKDPKSDPYHFDVVINGPASTILP
ncbi:MAG: hypothetical protein FWF85_04745 [Clostridiales bacterium]|nr:hypothetical protein [Clostridiales bacterium]